VSRLDSCLLCTGFPTRRRHLNTNIHFYHQLAMATHGVRRTGSAAIDLAWVACGRLDGFWEFGLNPWDMAAGRLLVTEAGGYVSDMLGKPHAFTSPHLLADNGGVHDPIVEIFAEVFAGRYRVPLPVISA
jgi:myo-inositol-1(or 4)-monophosphatase